MFRLVANVAIIHIKFMGVITSCGFLFHYFMFICALFCVEMTRTLYVGKKPVEFKIVHNPILCDFFTMVFFFSCSFFVFLGGRTQWESFVPNVDLSKYFRRLWRKSGGYMCPGARTRRSSLFGRCQHECAGQIHLQIN